MEIEVAHFRDRVQMGKEGSVRATVGVQGVLSVTMDAGLITVRHGAGVSIVPLSNVVTLVPRAQPAKVDHQKK